MKVVCVDKRHPGISGMNTGSVNNGYYTHITVNRVYDASLTKDRFGNLIQLTNDIGENKTYPVSNFILLTNYRNQQIDKIL